MKKLKRYKFYQYLIAILLVILTSSFPSFLLYIGNVGSIAFSEAAIFIGIFSGIGLVMFVLMLLISKMLWKSSLTASVLIAMFLNAGYLTRWLPYAILCIIFAIVSLVMIILIFRAAKESLVKTFVTVLSIVMALLFVLNTVMAIPKFTARSQADYMTDISQQYEKLSGHMDYSKVNKSELPNVYFFITDEYAGFNEIKNQYGYDNSAFADFLTEKKFTVSKASTNYMDGTDECLANVFNLQIDPNNCYDVTSEDYCRNKMRNGCLFDILENTGYSLYSTQTSDFSDLEMRTENFSDNWSTTEEGKTTIDVLIHPTLLCYFVDYVRAVLNGKPLFFYSGGGNHRENQSQNIVNVMKYYDDPQNYTYKNAFTLGYVCFPHEPFFFDENGDAVDTDRETNWADKSLYLGQYKYATKLLKNAMSSIIENDPGAIIILMSDHGVRNHASFDPSFSWMESIPVTDITDILCAVYYKGESFDSIDGMCGTNVVISVLNKAYGYSIPLIEQNDSMYFTPDNK